MPHSPFILRFYEIHVLADRIVRTRNKKAIMYLVTHEYK